MDYHSTSTDQKLGNGPADMPDRGGKAGGKLQSTSTMVNLNRKDHFVANLENKASMGEFQTTSEKCDLSRKTNSPYGPISATTPHTPLSGKGKK